MKLLLADDHEMVRLGVELLLLRINSNFEILHAKNYDELLQLSKTSKNVKMIILDRNMPGYEQWGDLNDIRQAQPSTPLAMMSASDDATHINEAIERGVDAYIPKACSEVLMRHAISLVLAGGNYFPHRKNNSLTDERIADSKKISSQYLTPLTQRQNQVLKLISEGNSNKKIADILNISQATVHTHTDAIYRALNVRSRTEAVQAAGFIN